MQTRDSYERFIVKFNIDKDELYKFGISETILPEFDLVAQSWLELKKRIFNNGPVKIRGYGRDGKQTWLYIDLYKQLFNNTKVVKDPTNNTEPQKIISRLTGYKRNRNLFNYQVSHIFGKTKNIFLFEAPWNIAFVPKVIDPFTGHESKGVWSIEYQKQFFNYSFEIYKEFIEEYNLLISDKGVVEGTINYINSLKTQPDLTAKVLQFEKDVIGELSAIEISPIKKSQLGKTSFIETPSDKIGVKKDDPNFYNMLVTLKREKNRSWVQLRKGCLDLLGISVTFTTQPMKYTSRAFARESHNTTGLHYREILQILDEKNLGQI